MPDAMPMPAPPRPKPKKSPPTAAGKFAQANIEKFQDVKSAARANDREKLRTKLKVLYDAAEAAPGVDNVTIFTSGMTPGQVAQIHQLWMEINGLGGKKRVSCHLGT